VKINPQQTSFGRHETFPLRVGWLPKSFAALEQNSTLFSRPEQAMQTLGVGRNMVKAIQYWLKVCGLVDFDAGADEHSTAITPLGRALLGPESDPYLEDDTTLWILHWLIASNAELATGFFWFFNRFALPRFKEADALEAIKEFAAGELHLHRATTSLRSDINTLLRLYAAVPGRTDEHLDALLAPLALVEADPEVGYRSPRGVRPELPLTALEFALAQRFAALADQEPLPVREILYAESGWAAPGAVFRLNEDGLMQHLEALIAARPGRYELRDSAGLHQLFRLDSAHRLEPLEVLKQHFDCKA
jgi:hypothetical protein